MHKCLAACFLLLFGTSVIAESPYADEQGRQIKALSAERIAGLKAGHGLGYAKAAELNGYPGPKHVLELADDLDLDADQIRRTEALHETMRERAGALGRDLIAVETELEETFAGASMSRQRLVELVSRSARIEGQIRLIHLQAHLEQLELLDDEQVAEYMRLRGYGEKASGHRHQHRH
ncbi:MULTISPECIES: hypothetical protein [unclassified Wenzhouxiangella]|uniref:hypothetical protein n=1 Tax=unclassified Wenzhouxiangella TaxID=2613841 RepID=UPI000E325CD9|nr:MULTISPECIES: hypothetical protein [unclassified Wenzhouxiangella]RFF27441.1 hypothetical protein DZK25_08550 [Wenzhouxiangella sp. 15181]RFP68869.1 hypothetical protein DZK26_06995 [Wenzhouxiangella sp. 15190]